MNARTVVGGVAVVLVVVVAAVAWYLTRPAAQEASIDNALEAVSADGAGVGDGGDGADGADASVLEDVSGTWAVDTGVGEFSFADATGSFVGFRVDEVLASVGETEAVGRTPAVSGTLVIDGTMLTEATLEADLTVMESDLPRRDNAMRRAMGVETNPTGTFVLTSPVDFGTVPVPGERVTFTAQGDLTVNGVTVPTAFQMEAEVADGRILVVGTSPVVFADHDVVAPSSPSVVSLEDQGTVEVQLWFGPA